MASIPEQEWKRTPPLKSGVPSQCPHGLKVFLVDGTYVRNNFDSDFDQGGNPEKFSWVPDGEIWLDWNDPAPEWPYSFRHECRETELMKNGSSYEEAHDHVKGLEDKERKKDDPGMDRKALALRRERSTEQQSGMAGLPTLADVTYQEPNKDGSRKHCASCHMYFPKEQACEIHEREVKVLPAMVCGYYINGEPEGNEDELDDPEEASEIATKVDPATSGLVTAPAGGASCDRCKWYVGGSESGLCLAVQDGGRPAVVDALGCCSRWEQ